MKKSIKSIMMFVLALMMCFTFAHTAKAATEYGLLVCGEQVTSDNMSGDGWRYEPATVEGEVGKLYLNNATLVADEAYGIGAGYNNVEIVLTGNNVIYINQDGGYRYGIFCEDITFSGGGSLTIKNGDNTDLTLEVIMAMIRCGNMTLEDNVKIYLECGKVTGNYTNGEFNVFYGIDCGDINMGKNTLISIDTYEFAGTKENATKISSLGLNSWGVVTVGENSEIRLNSKQAEDVLYSVGLSIDDLVMENNSKCYVNMCEAYGADDNVAFIVYNNLVVKDNVTIESNIYKSDLQRDEVDINLFSVGVFAKSITVGKNSVISGNAFCHHAYINTGVMAKEIISVGDNSVIKGKGSMYGYGMIIEDVDNISDYLAGGSDENTIKKLSPVEEDISYFSVDEGQAFTYDADKIASYVQVGPKVTAKFDANGGSVSKSSVTKYNGEKLGTLETPTRTGYTFMGWYTAKSGGTKIYSTTKLTKSMTLYAQWKKITYNITLNANGGSVGTTKLVIEYGDKLGAMPTPTRTGYTFTGWYTAATGGTKVYSTTKPTKSMTLYAQWKLNTYTIKFDGNGGTVGVEKKWVDHGNAMEFMPTPKREGYTFTGWFTAATGGNKVYSTTKVTKNMTLYAQWKLNTYTIKFDGNGGTVGVEKKWVDHGNAMNFMPTPKRDGYTFTGWFTAKTGGSKVYSATKVTKNMTLYAQWKKK